MIYLLKILSSSNELVILQYTYLCHFIFFLSCSLSRHRHNIYMYTHVRLVHMPLVYDLYPNISHRPHLLWQCGKGQSSTMGIWASQSLQTSLMICCGMKNKLMRWRFVFLLEDFNVLVVTLHCSNVGWDFKLQQNSKDFGQNTDIRIISLVHIL